MKARKRNFLHLRHCTGKSREQYRENTKMHKYPKVIISDNFDRRVLYLTVQKLKALILSGRTLTQLESYWGCSRDCRKKTKKGEEHMFCPTWWTREKVPMGLTLFLLLYREEESQQKAIHSSDSTREKWLQKIGMQDSENRLCIRLRLCWELVVGEQYCTSTETWLLYWSQCITDIE